MNPSRFERFLPWTGPVAGLCWIGSATIGVVGTDGEPGGASAAVARDNLTANTVANACTVVMAVALVFFAAAVRERLRSGEAESATYSLVAYGGWITVSAALAQTALWNKILAVAAEDGDSAAVTIFGYGEYFGWLAVSTGVSVAFIATGLGGLRNAVLPRWFAVVTVVLGVLALLGACSVPPGGLVGYLLLPFWLIAAGIIIAVRRKGASPVGSV